MTTSVLDLSQLKARLNRLGVEVRGDGGAAPLSPPPAQSRRSPALHRANAGRGAEPGAAERGRRGMADLFERINRVERAMTSADAQSSAIQQTLQEDLGNLAVVAAEAEVARSPTKPERGAGKKVKSGTKGLRQSSLAPAPQGLSAAVRNIDHMRSIPAHTPLSSVLAQFKEAETAWAHEKARLRREAIDERKRANKLELDFKRQQRMQEHNLLDIKALKTALKSRDSQLESASERIRELDMALHRTQEDAALAISGLNAERDDLKSLLLAALQRLEAVDELVQRADISSAMMEDKMHLLEEERTKALDAASRARIEVSELAESRRKLQWQSKLLEKMSEVQLKHNKRKSEAIRRLLSVDEQGGAGGGYQGGDLGHADSELLDDDL